MLVLDADAWSLTNPAGLPGGILLGNDGATSDYDDWRAIELDALGAEVARWDVPGSYPSMSVAANASQGGVGPAGLFFWIAKGGILETYGPGGVPIASTDLGSAASRLFYDDLQDTLKRVTGATLGTIDRNFNLLGSSNFAAIVGIWDGPGGFILDTGQVLEKVDSNGNSTGTVTRETDHIVGEVGLDCLQRQSGNYVVTGRLPYNPETPSVPQWHSWVIELDGSGNIQWQNSAPADSTTGHFGVPIAQGPQDLVMGLGGGRCVEVQGVGTLSQTSVRLDRTVHALSAIPQGGYVAAAWALGNGFFTADHFELIRVGADLSTTWIQDVSLNAAGIFGGMLVDAPKTIVPVQDGFLIGTAPFVGGTPRAGITKIGLDGSFVGAWSYQLANHQVMGSPLLVARPDGGYLLAASVAESTNPGGFPTIDPTNGLVILLDESMQPVEYTLYGGAESEYFQSVMAMEDGYLFAGNSLSLGERSEAWILRTDLECKVSAGCIAVIAEGPWPLDATFETLTGQSIPALPMGMPGLPAESAVFSPATPIAATVVARQCSGRAAPLEPDPQPGDTFTLTIRHQGGGMGRVTSTPAGIDCGGTCEFQFPAGSTVGLTPIVSPGSFFSHWAGVDLDIGIEGAEVVMNSNRTVDVWFE
jgi:hypothetical protein